MILMPRIVMLKGTGRRTSRFEAGGLYMLPGGDAARVDARERVQRAGHRLDLDE